MKKPARLLKIVDDEGSNPVTTATSLPLRGNLKPAIKILRKSSKDGSKDLSSSSTPVPIQRFEFTVDLGKQKLVEVSQQILKKTTKRKVEQPELLKEDELFLHTGAEISLFSIDGSGYVFSDGFMDTSCKLRIPRSRSRAPLDFSDCVFQVFHRYKYDARDCLEDAYTKLGRSLKGMPQNELDLTEAEDEQISILIKKYKMEIQENEAEFLRLASQPIVYGQVIQLKHVKSNKFLSISVKEAAELENDCFQVLLEESGNEGSWFIILPRFKMRSEGEKVRMGDQIVMLSRKYNFHLHLSQNQTNTEVNASSRLSSWRIIPYSAWNPTADFLYANTPVRLMYEEVDALITHELLSLVEKQKQNCDDLFLECSSTGYFNSNAIWLVEVDNTMRGGVCTYDKVYHFKHIATGKYLAIEKHDSANHADPKLDENRSGIRLKMVNGPNSMDSLFEICPLDRDQKKHPNDPIRLDSYFILRHQSTNLWIHAQEEDTDHNTDNTLLTEQKKESKRIRLVGDTVFHDGNFFSLRKVNKQEAEDLYSSMSEIGGRK